MRWTDEVTALLEAWLEELRVDGLHLTEESAAGARQNLWCMSLPSSEPLTEADLLAFLRSAMVIRRELAHSQSVRPVTFYAWHDEMAGQLRISTACCTKTALPFGTVVRLIDEPDEIIASFLSSPYRDGIPWSDIKESLAGDDEPPPSAEPLNLAVWAVEWR